MALYHRFPTSSFSVFSSNFFSTNLRCYPAIWAGVSWQVIWNFEHKRFENSSIVAQTCHHTASFTAHRPRLPPHPPVMVLERQDSRCEFSPKISIIDDGQLRERERERERETSRLASSNNDILFKLRESSKAQCVVKCPFFRPIFCKMIWHDNDLNILHN